MSTTLLWVRRDLRQSDNPALHAACRAHDRVLPVYIHAPDAEGNTVTGAAGRWWLHHSLAALQAAYRAGGADLHVRTGDPASVLIALAAQTGATTVRWNEALEPDTRARDERTAAALHAHGLHVKVSPDAWWTPPDRPRTSGGGPYRVFTPYWRALRPQLGAPAPLPEADWRGRVVQTDGSVPIAALGLLPSIDWAAGLRATWTPGEAGARDLLEIFCDDALTDYTAARDAPARHGTTHLSPALHWGEITPRQIHRALADRAASIPAKRRPDVEPVLRQLGWRDFSLHLLHHRPDTPTQNVNPKFNAFPWADPDPQVLRRWQHGRTGVPLVDAGMRQLWRTGWMHNRVRMVVASYLTKNLRIDWRHGARWFHDTLVDADLANNTMGWQWVAGCGVDAAPYFRVFNPVAQARRYDPKGAYVRAWVPELATAPDRVLFEPWTDPSWCAAHGYPPPLVDLGGSRAHALRAYKTLAAAPTTGASR